MIFVVFSGQFSLLGKQKPLGCYIIAPTYSSPEFASPTLVYKLFFERGFFRKKLVARLCLLSCLYLNRVKALKASINFFNKVLTTKY